MTAAVAIAAAGPTLVPAYADGYTARKTFDDWDRRFQQGGPGQSDQPNDP